MKNQWTDKTFLFSVLQQNANLGQGPGRYSLPSPFDPTKDSTILPSIKSH